MVTQTDEMGKKAALLSAVEVGLGSLMHAFYVPFAGHLLSLNQAFLLTWASREIPSRQAPGLISTTAALLKSLSPAGKKLTPMLAIAMQGQLFTIGVFIGGANIVGHILGAILLCLWGFLQPLALYFVLYGKTLIDVANYFIEQMSTVFPVTLHTLGWMLALLIVLKIFMAIACVALAHQLPQKNIERYTTWAQTTPAPKRVRSRNVYVAALRDLFTPVFLLSWILTLLFFVYAEADVWVLLRPIAVGYLLFLGLRLFPTASARFWLEHHFPKLSSTLSVAIKYLRPND